MEWVKGQLVGRGSFATVHLAATASGVVAVKSTAHSLSESLRREEEILSRLRDCPEIVACLGHDVTVDAAGKVYNLFLEYLSGGSLHDLRLRSGGRMPEGRVRRLARSALRGLSFIHANGYVHGDVKPHNLLVASPEKVKIADFGLAKRAGEEAAVVARLRGTPLYMSPEAVGRGECEAPADVWGLGCTVAEMVAGRPAWKCAGGGDVAALLCRIGSGEESPEVPQEMSEQGRDFLGKCFVRDPARRWTAAMLLEHPFIAGAGEDDEDSSMTVFESPRSAFDFAQWEEATSSLPPAPTDPTPLMASPSYVGDQSPARRIRMVAGRCHPPHWFESSSEDWITVFDHQNRIESTSQRLVAEESRSSSSTGMLESTPVLPLHSNILAFAKDGKRSISIDNCCIGSTMDSCYKRLRQ